MTREHENLIAALESQFGPLHAARSKPFSQHYRDVDGQVLIKLYRVIEPATRQAQELEALATAPEFGIRVPSVLEHGRHGEVAWTAIEMIPGTALSIQSSGDASVFTTAARSLLSPLHSQMLAFGPGYGWDGPAEPSTSAFLSRQLSSRIRTLPSWSELHKQIRRLDHLPVVRLHGDVKPDHILVGAGPPTLVDWEASGRGPAVVDEADIAFRVARDLIYTGNSSLSEANVNQSQSPLLTPALAWRIALWLDRRHSNAPRKLATLVKKMTSEPTISTMIETVRRAKMLGTRY